MIVLLLGLLLGIGDLESAEGAYRKGQFREAYTLFEAALSEPVRKPVDG